MSAVWLLETLIRLYDSEYEGTLHAAFETAYARLLPDAVKPYVSDLQLEVTMIIDNSKSRWISYSHGSRDEENTSIRISIECW